MVGKCRFKSENNDSCQEIFILNRKIPILDQKMPILSQKMLISPQIFLILPQNNVIPTFQRQFNLTLFRIGVIPQQSIHRHDKPGGTVATLRAMPPR